MSALVRFTRLSVLPGLALPIAAQIVGGATAPTSGYWGGVNLIAGVYLWILLGSMCLNACLITRHGKLGQSGRSDRVIAVTLPALTAVIVAGIVLLAVRAYDTPLLIVGGVAAVLSIVITAAAVQRSGARAAAFSTLLLEAPTWLRVGYLIVVALAIVGSVTTDLSGDYLWAPSFIENPATWILLLLGLPWSFWVQVACFAALFAPFLASWYSSGTGGVTVMTVALTVPAMVNAVVVARSLRPDRPASALA
jgi:hypothetical protein